MEIARRVEAIFLRRLKGAQAHDIFQYASRRKWGVTERQIRNYIRRADDLIIERQDKRRKAVLARHFAQRMVLYAKALSAKDYRTALAILDSDAKLRGLFPERDLKELAKLATAQGERIAQLERQIRDANTVATDPPANTGERTAAGGGRGDGTGGEGSSG